MVPPGGSRHSTFTCNFRPNTSTLRQHAAANGEDIDAYVSQIISNKLQAEMEFNLRQNAPEKTFGEWLQECAHRHSKLDHEIYSIQASIYARCGE